MTFEILKAHKTHDGKLYLLSHESLTTKSKMAINLFVPRLNSSSIPVLVYVSGLTCSPQNASEKSGIFAYAAKYGIAVVFPDTSPKDLDIPGSKDSQLLGEGASFYVNATKEPYKEHYQMFDYVLKDVPLLAKQWPSLDFSNKSIIGHSMGGFGTLLLFLRNNTSAHTEYKSASCFAPLSNPLECEVGKNALLSYLSESDYPQYDIPKLFKSYTGPKSTILVHQGTDDSFFEDKTLQSDKLAGFAEGTDLSVDFRFVEGYDHGYYFVNTFIKDHMKHHAKALGVL